MPKTYQNTLTQMQEAILKRDPADVSWMKPAPKLAAKLSEVEQLEIYRAAYKDRLLSALSEDYPLLKAFVGTKAFKEIATDYIYQHPSEYYDIGKYTAGFAAFVAGILPKNAAEIARFEAIYLRLEGADAHAELSADSLRALSLEAFLHTPLPLRNGLEFAQFAYPIQNYYEAHLAGKNAKRHLSAEKPTYLALWQDSAPQFLVLEAQEFQLLTLLAAQKTLEKAFEALCNGSEIAPESLISKIEQWFQRWTAHKLLAA